MIWISRGGDGWLSPPSRLCSASRYPLGAGSLSAGEELDDVVLGVAEHRDADVADRGDVDLDRGAGGAESVDHGVEVGDLEGEVADAEGGGQALRARSR